MYNLSLLRMYEIFGLCNLRQKWHKFFFADIAQDRRVYSGRVVILNRWAIPKKYIIYLST